MEWKPTGLTKNGELAFSFLVVSLLYAVLTDYCIAGRLSSLRALCSKRPSLSFILPSPRDTIEVHILLCMLDKYTETAGCLSWPVGWTYDGSARSPAAFIKTDVPDDWPRYPPCASMSTYAHSQSTQCKPRWPTRRLPEIETFFNSFTYKGLFYMYECMISWSWMACHRMYWTEVCETHVIVPGFFLKGLFRLVTNSSLRIGRISLVVLFVESRTQKTKRLIWRLDGSMKQQTLSIDLLQNASTAKRQLGP